MIIDVHRELRVRDDVSPTAVRRTEKTGLRSRSSAAVRWRHVRGCMKQLTRGFKRSRQPSVTDQDKKRLWRASLLHKDFWLEALDTHHRYGFHLRAFHRAWKREMAELETVSSNAKDTSFFYWLDHGNGRNVEVPECTHHALWTTRVEYCNADQRKAYLLTFSRHDDDRVVRLRYAASGSVVHTDEQSKWIFVIDLVGCMYLGRKRKGRFHHSSFVSGAPIVAAGKISIVNGMIIAVEPHSGHFKPRLENLQAFCSIVAKHGVDIKTIAFIKPKKWTCVWPFPVQPELDEEELVTASDTDYGVDKSEEEESNTLLQEHEL